MAALTALVSGCAADASSGLDADAGSALDAHAFADDTEHGGSDATPADVDGASVAADVDRSPVSELLAIEHAPPALADLIFVRLEGAGLGETVVVDSILHPVELWVDPEDTLDARYPFIVRLVASDGATLFQKTLREPIQMREFFLASGFGDYNLFEVFPQLAQFAVALPRVEGAERVTFSRREAEGGETPLGSAVLATIPVVATRSDVSVARLHGAAPSDQALDIVIVGDGYTAEELDAYRAQADAVAAGFLATEPFHSYADRINIHRVDMVSHESGASYDCDAKREIAGCRDGFKDTAFASLYPLRLAQTLGLHFDFDYVLLQADQWAVARAAATVPFDTVVVLVNTQKLGAFGLWVTSINGPGDDTHEGVVHEFGHAFGHLADEYRHAGDVCQSFTLTPDYPNLAPLGARPEDVPWQAWLTPDVPLPTPADDALWRDAIGQFAGAGGGCDDHYKPSRQCLMNSWGTPMCPVCYEQMVKRFYTTFDVLAREPLRLDGHRLELVRNDERPVIGRWSVDGAPAGDAALPLVLPTSDAPRTYTVEATVREGTPAVRTDADTLDEHVLARVLIAP